MSNHSYKIFLIVTLFVSSTIFAEVTEVTAPTMEDQLSSIEDILTNRLYPAESQQTESLRRINQTVQQSLTGSNGTGGSNNLTAEQKFRDWTPSTTDLMNMIQQGLQTGSLADQLTYYNQRYPVPTIEQLSPNNASNPLANHDIFSAVTTNAALSIADKGFDNAGQIMEQINFLYRQIDQQQTTKQSQDLNSVILLKIAALQADLMRLQSQQLKMQAVSNAENNSKRAFMTQFVQDIK